MDCMSNNVLCISQRPTLKVNPNSGTLKAARKNRWEVIVDNQYPAMTGAPTQMQMAASDVMARSACLGSSKTNLEDVELGRWNLKEILKKRSDHQRNYPNRPLCSSKRASGHNCCHVTAFPLSSKVNKPTRARQLQNFPASQHSQLANKPRARGPLAYQAHAYT